MTLPAWPIQLLAGVILRTVWLYRGRLFMYDLCHISADIVVIVALHSSTPPSPHPER